mmetsp:Transcript_34807/g.81262  ORF Transcript_34807/g.81262 Transcript_34807/m.81262 type:complete len:204 (-) Transcript_34807:587-1198(-)
MSAISSSLSTEVTSPQASSKNRCPWCNPAVLTSGVGINKAPVSGRPPAAVALNARLPKARVTVRLSSCPRFRSRGRPLGPAGSTSPPADRIRLTSAGRSGAWRLVCLVTFALPFWSPSSMRKPTASPRPATKIFSPVSRTITALQPSKREPGPFVRYSVSTSSQLLRKAAATCSSPQSPLKSVRRANNFLCKVLAQNSAHAGA